ncbi:DUF222 domain-containing protein [Demequina sp. SO4-13]|uniref:HNH endonuclease signature motif containing protein n=1 Tax=Demequina sp. SO4-13 TaxID=3401027 RepID=UPI003AF9DFEC
MTTTTESAPPVQDDWAELVGVLREAHRLMDKARGPLAGPGVRELNEDLLMEVHGELAGVKKSWDLCMAPTSAEIGRRSTPDLGSTGLSRKRGFTDPADMLANQTGGSRRDARTLIDVGRAMADAEAQERKELEALATGAPPPEPEEPVYPAVARALAEGRIGVESARAITGMLDSVREMVTREVVAETERLLVAKAPGLSTEKFRVVVRRHLAWLRAEAAEERQKNMAADRYLLLTEQSDGMVEIRGRLDPVSAAPLRAAIEGMVKRAFRMRRDDPDPLAPDNRTVGQIRADALSTFARHMLGCSKAPISRASTTVVVRIGLDELRRGVGAAEVEGGDGVIPVSELRRLGVDAQYIPVVLGGKGEVLDVGRKWRRFSRAQRTGFLERDGGCAMCGAPPSHCEAHHIKWWDRDRGRTDLSNGVMLCVACHHTVHGNDWGIKTTHDQVWFIPPAEVDPARTPRLGGRARFGVTPEEREQLVAAGSPRGPNDEDGPDDADGPGDEDGADSELELGLFDEPVSPDAG